MATISTRINSSGTYFVNGTFDEVTYNRTSPVIKNLLISTEDFSQWANVGHVITTNQAIAPDGSLTADRIQATTGSGGDYTAILNNSSVGGASYTFSFWVKSVSGATGTWGVNYYNGAHNRTTVPITGEWARQYITFTGTGGQFNVYIADNRTSLATITDAYVWGAQLERGTTPTIYQGITSSGTLITPTFKNKVTSDAVYVTDIFDEVTFNPLTRGLYIGNSLSYSQDMSQTSVWNYSSGGSGVPPVVTPNAALAPDGTLTANRVFFNSGPVTGTGQSSLNQGNAIPLTIGTSQTFSVWMRVETTATGVNMFNGEAINSILLDTNWTRYSLPITYSSPVAYGVRIAKREIWGTGGSANVLIWGAQLNSGLTATVHVPTGANATPISIAVKKETSDGTSYVTGAFDEFTGAPVVDSSLVLWLDAGQSTSYPGTGTTWTDLSASNTTSTLTNGPTYTSENGGSIVFNGTNNYISTSLTPNTTQGSMSVWFKMNLLKDYNTLIDNLVGANDWELWVYATGIARFRTTANNTDIIVDSPVLSANIWYNITVCWSATSSELYTNGILSSQDTTMATRTVPTTLNIGGGNAGNTKFNGFISIVQIYNRALTADEVQQNFNALRRRYSI